MSQGIDSFCRHSCVDKIQLFAKSCFFHKHEQHLEKIESAQMKMVLFTTAGQLVRRLTQPSFLVQTQRCGK